MDRVCPKYGLPELQTFVGTKLKDLRTIKNRITCLYKKGLAEDSVVLWVVDTVDINVYELSMNK